MVICFSSKVKCLFNTEERGSYLNKTIYRRTVQSLCKNITQRCSFWSVNYTRCKISIRYNMKLEITNYFIIRLSINKVSRNKCRKLSCHYHFTIFRISRNSHIFFYFWQTIITNPHSYNFIRKVFFAIVVNEAISIFCCNRKSHSRNKIKMTFGVVIIFKNH